MHPNKAETASYQGADRICWPELHQELLALEEQVRRAEARIVSLRRHLAAGAEDAANAGPPSARAA